MKLYFRVETLHPDQRQYRQTELELKGIQGFPVLAEIEVRDENVAELPKEFVGMEGVHPQVINLAGLRELADQFDLVFLSPSPSKQYNQSEKKDEWEDEDNDEDDWDKEIGTDEFIHDDWGDRD